MPNENVTRFINQLSRSLEEDTFVKMTLGNYKGGDRHLQKILVRLISTKRGIRLFFLYRYDTRDTAKNYSMKRGVEMIHSFLDGEFFSGHLFTTGNDFQLEIGKKGRSRLNKAKPTFRVKPDLSHDRKKKRLVDPSSFYLKALGVTNEEGVVRKKQQDKWKQINRFVETLGKFFDDSPLSRRKSLDVVDMGSGKGYLTFAAYDFLTNQRNIDVRMRGIDTKMQLVELCNDISKAAEFDGLEFSHGSIEDCELGHTDMLIALHACDTATDDAIFKGIKAEAELILVAPCCHHELRPQLSPPKMLKGVLRHGTLLDTHAETITDGLRSLLLEKHGYKTRVFEFVSTEHTPKNNMIVGTIQKDPKPNSGYEEEISKIKDFYGIRSQRLDSLLST